MIFKERDFLVDFFSWILLWEHKASHNKILIFIFEIFENVVSLRGEQNISIQFLIKNRRGTRGKLL